MAKEQEQTELSPRQRLDSLIKMMAVLGFFRNDEEDEQIDNELKKYKDLDGNEREDFDLLQEAAFAATDPKVEQHYFDQIKNFFVKKLNYDGNLFNDENLAQFVQQFDKLMKEDKERAEIAEKFIPEVEKRIHDLTVEGIRLRAIEPPTKEIKNQLRTVMGELKKLRDRRAQVVEPVYKTRHKKVVN